MVDDVSHDGLLPLPAAGPRPTSGSPSCSTTLAPDLPTRKDLARQRDDGLRGGTGSRRPQWRAGAGSVLGQEPAQQDDGRRDNGAVVAVECVEALNQEGGAGVADILEGAAPGRGDLDQRGAAVVGVGAAAEQALFLETSYTAGERRGGDGFDPGEVAEL